MTRRILAAAVCGRGGDESEMVELRITDERLHASGVFSNVYQAHLVHPEERRVAIKKIWPKDGQRNNDLHFLQQLSHPHIVRLLYHFHVTFDKHRVSEHR
jgi:serine/threonine protein kinase